MKQGWEIKKLGEVCSLIADGDWIESRHQSDDGIRLIQTGNIGNGVFKAKDDKPHYISESTFVELGCTEIFAGDCLVSRLPDPVGRACIIPETNCRMITAVDCSIIRFNSDIVSKFFIYYTQCEKYRRDIDNNTTGTTRKRISRKNLESICIPIPPREEQERIVEELDCLSEVIEKKREQLKELDALAQSIFYQMFGDPITNEKRWEVIPLKQAALLKAGKAIKANELSEESNFGLYPCYGGNGIRGYINKKSHNGLFPIIGRQGALCGNVVFAQGEFYATEHAVVCNNIIDSINPLWLYYALRYNNLNRYAQGVAQPGISVNIINEMPLIYPSLSLQQEFAEKIEAIEKQKELIKKSIAETEELFNSRMDYYFN